MIPAIKSSQAGPAQPQKNWSVASGGVSQPLAAAPGIIYNGGGLVKRKHEAPVGHPGCGVTWPCARTGVGVHLEPGTQQSGLPEHVRQKLWQPPA